MIHAIATMKHVFQATNSRIEREHKRKNYMSWVKNVSPLPVQGAISCINNVFGWNNVYPLPGHNAFWPIQPLIPFPF